MKKILLIPLTCLTVMMIVGCSKQASTEANPENNVNQETTSQNGDSFEDINGNIITKKEVKQQEKDYYRLIKEEKFNDALDIEETLLFYSDKNGLSQDMADELNNNHNILIDLDLVNEKIKAAEKDQEPSYEGEILSWMDEIKNNNKTDTKEVNDIINQYNKRIEKVFSKISKDTGLARYTEMSGSDGNEDYDENGEVKDRGGVMVDQDPISEDNVKSSDDVYGNE